jgi:hypothetical protein
MVTCAKATGIINRRQVNKPRALFSMFRCIKIVLSGR